MAANLIVQRETDRKVVNVQDASSGGGGGGGVGIQLHPPEPQPRQLQVPAATPPPNPRPLHVPPAPRPPPPLPRRPFPQNNAMNEEELLSTMNEFANPLKKTGQTGEYYDDDDGGMSEGMSDGLGASDGGGGGTVNDMDESIDGDLPPPHMDLPYAVEEEEKPSEGYANIDEEKSDIIFKLQRLHRQGIKGIRVFTPYSDIRDMRSELSRVKTELELERSIKFQRQLLMTIVSTLEWGNSKFNPFDLELDGWSEVMHGNVQTSQEYDGVFEELYFKYRNKVSTPPEIRLLLMVGGSAMMFHMTKSMTKALTAAPAHFESLMRGPSPQQQRPPHHEEREPPGSPAKSVRREMKGPGVDVLGGLGGLGGLGNMAGGLGGLGGLAGGLGGLGNLAGALGGGFPGMSGPSAGTIPPPPPPPNPALNPVSTRNQQQRRPPIDVPQDDDMSERLSDVVSEDLQSIPSDDFSDASDARPKRINLAPPPPARGKQKRQKTQKKVITL